MAKSLDERLMHQIVLNLREALAGMTKQEFIAFCQDVIDETEIRMDARKQDKQ